MAQTTGILWPELLDLRELGAEDGYHARVAETGRGQVEMRLYQAPETELGVIAVGGVGGGFDSPARGLYPRLGAELAAEGIKLLRVKFRSSTHLAEAIHDVLAGIAVLRIHGVTRIGLVGHSFGGAVVIGAAAVSPAVRSVVTLATQSYGTNCVVDLQAALLLLHGNADEILPPVCSVTTFQKAPDPKELVLLEGAGHGLDEAAEQVHGATKRWFLETLSRP